jgi:hypothetical protein
MSAVALENEQIISPSVVQEASQAIPLLKMDSVPGT